MDNIACMVHSACVKMVWSLSSVCNPRPNKLLVQLDCSGADGYSHIWHLSIATCIAI